SHFVEKDAYWNEKFHVWTMDWDENNLSIYLDGELLNSIDLTKTMNGKIGDYANPFHAPQYILLNLALGGINGGEPMKDAFPMKYEIDYVRVYKELR
ncbi:MAG: family 16 glycosylhydrolase, partial [Prevotellaceae bacterium]|nr:family 16 glycosylhydrolase [Candidatus Minthosoma caballi]